MHIQINNPTTKIPGPSSNLVKCVGFLGFTLKPDGVFTDHRGIGFTIHRVGKDIINQVIKSAWNCVITEKVKCRKEWAYIKDLD